jgi:hypothetical protein
VTADTVAGSIPETHVQTLIRETCAVVRSTNALAAAAALKIDFRKVISPILQASPLEQIRATALRASASIDAFYKTKTSVNQGITL